MLAGRDREYARIDRLLRDAQQGRRGVLVVLGGAGIGKTALLEYAISRAGSMTVVRALGVESEAELEFSGLLEICRPLLPWLRSSQEVKPTPSAAPSAVGRCSSTIALQSGSQPLASWLRPRARDSSLSG